MTTLPSRIHLQRHRSPMGSPLVDRGAEGSSFLTHWAVLELALRKFRG